MAARRRLGLQRGTRDDADLESLQFDSQDNAAARLDLRSTFNAKDVHDILREFESSPPDHEGDHPGNAAPPPRPPPVHPPPGSGAQPPPPLSFNLPDSKNNKKRKKNTSTATPPPPATSQQQQQQRYPRVPFPVDLDLLEVALAATMRPTQRIQQHNTTATATQSAPKRSRLADEALPRGGRGGATTSTTTTPSDPLTALLRSGGGRAPNPRMHRSASTPRNVRTNNNRQNPQNPSRFRQPALLNNTASIIQGTQHNTENDGDDDAIVGEEGVMNTPQPPVTATTNATTPAQDAFLSRLANEATTPAAAAVTTNARANEQREEEGGQQSIPFHSFHRHRATRTIAGNDATRGHPSSLQNRLHRVLKHDQNISAAAVAAGPSSSAVLVITVIAVERECGLLKVRGTINTTNSTLSLDRQANGPRQELFFILNGQHVLSTEAMPGCRLAVYPPYRHIPSLRDHGNHDQGFSLVYMCSGRIERYCGGGIV